MINKNIIFFLIIFINVSSLYSEAVKFSLGVSCPLTGDLSEYGVAIKNGLELAKREEDSSLSNIKIIYQDNAYQSVTAVRAFNSLVNISKVDLIYNWGEAPLHAVAPLAKKKKSASSCNVF